MGQEIKHLQIQTLKLYSGCTAGVHLWGRQRNTNRLE
jgi:hypothetical protein